MSGTDHTFSDVASAPDGPKVVQSFEGELTEEDVIGTFAKALDVQARSVTLLCRSATPTALRLVHEYGLTLKFFNVRASSE